MAYPHSVCVVEALPKTNEIYELVDESLEYAGNLPDSMQWPAYYGSIPGTCAPDGDPVDMALFSDCNLERGQEIGVRILGLLEFIDRGEVDHKLFGVTDADIDPPQEEVARMVQELAGFLALKKLADGTNFTILGARGPEAAEAYISAHQKA